MNFEEEAFLEKMKDRCRLSFEDRGKMAFIQQKDYLEKKSRGELKDIKKMILKWMSSQEKFTEANKPILFDFEVFHSSNKKEIENYLLEKDKEIVNILGQSSNYQYIYVTQRNDGMVITVGKSSRNAKSRGDLFSLLNTNGLSGTENVILRTEYGNEIFEKYDIKLRTYINKAWMVLIEYGNAKELERELGNKLIEKGVPILNYYSHRQ